MISFTLIFSPTWRIAVFSISILTKIIIHSFLIYKKNAFLRINWTLFLIWNKSFGYRCLLSFYSNWDWRVHRRQKYLSATMLCVTFWIHYAAFSNKKSSWNHELNYFKISRFLHYLHYFQRAYTVINTRCCGNYWIKCNSSTSTQPSAYVLLMCPYMYIEKSSKNAVLFNGTELPLRDDLQSHC